MQTQPVLINFKYPNSCNRLETTTQSVGVHYIMGLKSTGSLIIKTREIHTLRDNLLCQGEIPLNVIVQLNQTEVVSLSDSEIVSFTHRVDLELECSEEINIFFKQRGDN